MADKVFSSDEISENDLRMKLARAAWLADLQDHKHSPTELNEQFMKVREDRVKFAIRLVKNLKNLGYAVVKE